MKNLQANILEACLEISDFEVGTDRRAVRCAAARPAVAPYHEQNNSLSGHGLGAFSLVEAMMAVVIFGMLVLMVASMLNVCLHAATRVEQRHFISNDPDRVLQRLKQAMEASVFHRDANSLYAWHGKDEGRGIEEADRMSCVTTLAPDATGARGDFSPLERILVAIHADGPGRHPLVLYAGPYTMGNGNWARETVLMRDVKALRIRYWNLANHEWADGWSDGEHPPAAVWMGIVPPNENADENPDDWKHVCVARIPAEPK